LHDLINACLYQPFARMKNNNKPRWNSVREEIYRVGLTISGPRLEPVAIQTTFILARSATPSTKLDLCLSRWWGSATEALRASGEHVQLMGNVYLSSEALDLRTYERLVPMEWL
jgi:hypothetical protein